MNALTSRRGRKPKAALDRAIGAKIRARRRQLDLTRKGLAERLGLSFQQIHKYECGADRLGGHRRADFAAALGVPVSYFFGRNAEQMTAEHDSLLNTRGAVPMLIALP